MPVNHAWTVNEHPDGTAHGWCKCGWQGSGPKDQVHRQANDTDNH